MARAVEEDKVAHVGAWRALTENAAATKDKERTGYGHMQYLPNGGTVTRTNTLRTSKRDSANYSANGGAVGGKRASATTTADEDRDRDRDRERDRKAPSPIPSPGSPPPPAVILERLSAKSTSPPPQQGQPSSLRRRPSLTQKVAEYIKPPRPSQPGSEEPPQQRPTTRGGPARARLRSKFAEGVDEEP